LFLHSLLLEGSSLDARSMRNALVKADVLHYAGHSQRIDAGGGLTIGGVGAPSGGSILHAGDLYAMSFPHCQLAVLSGCSTGLGSQEGWIDRDGMILPFLNSGVHCVVASKWQVDSSTTGGLMRTFYSELLAGKSVVESLHIAEERVRAGPRTKHPFFWATFDTYGHCDSQS